MLTQSPAPIHHGPPAVTVVDPASGAVSGPLVPIPDWHWDGGRYARRTRLVTPMPTPRVAAQPWDRPAPRMPADGTADPYAWSGGAIWRREW